MGTVLPMPAVPSYYDILGVRRSATSEQIQQAYRRLARQSHPDLNPGPAAEERFKSISEAYDVLSDREARRRYDAFGPNFRKVPAGTSPSPWHRAGRIAADLGLGDRAAVEDMISGWFRPRQPGAPGRRRPGWSGDDSSATDTDDDAVVLVHVPAPIAALGGEVVVDTPAGPTRVRVPEGTVSGRRLRLRGKGVATGADSADVIAVVVITVPDDLSDEQRRLYERLAELEGPDPT